MDLSRWTGGKARCGTRAGRRLDRPDTRNVTPACEALEGRQLLSTAAATAILPAPPATAVANATADLDSLDPSTFLLLQGYFERAESHSRVTEVEADALAALESTIDQDVQAAGLDADSSSADINNVENVIDTAFVATSYTRKDWMSTDDALQSYLQGVPGTATLVHETISMMRVVADSSRVNEKLSLPLYGAGEVLGEDLGSNPDTNLGPGATDADPLTVYYDSQVNHFVKQ
jgi:hypothetical protein